jgi:hypothetical protein
MSQTSNYLENALGNHVLRGGTAPMTAVAQAYLALYSTNPTDADSGTEITGGAYARQAANFGAPSNGVFTNSGIINFPVATANYPAAVRYMGLRDASTAGNLLWYGPCLVGTPVDFVAVASSDVFTSPGHGFSNNDLVVLMGENLPTGVDASTLYYIVNITTDTFQLSTTSGGAAINITANGSGKAVKDGSKTININDQFTVPVGNLSVAIL